MLLHKVGKVAEDLVEGLDPFNMLGISISGDY